MVGVSFQIITQLLEVPLRAKGEIKSECGVVNTSYPPTSVGQATLELLVVQVTACQGNLEEK